MRSTVLTLTQATEVQERPESGPPPRSRRRRDLLVDLGIVAAVALVLRLSEVGFGLPAMLNSDEPWNITVGTDMAAHGDWDPHYFSYPSLMYDVVAVADRIQRLLTGHMLTAADFGSQGMGINQTSDPDMVVALRLITVALSVGICLLLCGVVRRVTGRRWVAVGAGLLGATSPLLVGNALYVTPDTYSAFFTAATLAGALAVVRRGSRLDYVLAGIAVGCALGSKYNFMCAVPVVVAYLLHEGKNAWRWRALISLALTGAVAAATFALTTPALLFDSNSLVTGLQSELTHYSAGHSGAQGGALGFYLSDLLHDQAVLLPGAAVAIAAACFGRFRKEILVVGSFAVGYFALISSEVVRFDRDLLPLLPALMLLTGFSVAWLVELAAAGRPVAWLRAARLPQPARLAVASLVVIAVTLPAVLGATRNVQALDEAPRAEAAAWLQAHVPQGSTVVDEHYGPWLDTTEFHVVEVGYAVIDPLPSNAAAIVITQNGSGRFLDYPAQNADQMADYDTLLQTYCVAVKYTDGPWVEILTPCQK
ncbi:phospholipid carrier-dependent glycosyltransferase [Actinospica durhamensis]|uniref:Phospholipid carrier-dependent glycosyltransferase n=1 Tax=Actinospica durhamensis TaxID=1508375 RepID=A0A941EVW6_9ACTN|nr:phospholipid carrier-dependent glycosyltransferase [Actinospica durhamensis]MBR7839132.1 phospholipid carrier-dependent glycosyltransferase [Actinospica durhamensis]